MRRLAAVVLSLLALSGVAALAGPQIPDEATKAQDRPAFDGPVIPDEATKTWALKRAYQLNGNSMVGWGSIDLSKEVPAKSVRIIPIVPKGKKVDR